jgi:hypothetical protein
LGTIQPFLQAVLLQELMGGDWNVFDPGDFIAEIRGASRTEKIWDIEDNEGEDDQNQQERAYQIAHSPTITKVT